MIPNRPMSSHVHPLALPLPDDLADRLVEVADRHDLLVVEAQAIRDETLALSRACQGSTRLATSAVSADHLLRYLQQHDPLQGLRPLLAVIESEWDESLTARQEKIAGPPATARGPGY